MMSKEYCRYIRTYSELEGLQHAHTLVYCGAAAAQGVVMELRQEQDGRVRRSAVLLQNSFAGQCSCCATCVKTASVWSSGWTFWTMQARVMNCWKMQARPDGSRLYREKLGFLCHMPVLNCKSCCRLRN